MSEILTVTLNPALDLSTSVVEVLPEVKLRCAPPITDPGGGGLNVSRAIAILGGSSRSLVALGGDIGVALRALLESEGLDLIVHPAPGETRQSLAVTDLKAHQQYRFMLPGPDWMAADIEAVRAAIRDAAPRGGYVVLSGSGPAGAAPDLYARICADLSATGARVIVDTSNPALAHLAAGQPNPPFVLRMDTAEAEALARRPLPHPADSMNFAASLVARGAARVVIMARGAEGSVLASAETRLHVRAARVQPVSKIGAGDSFVGAFTLALARGADLAEALSHGAAAASSAVTTEGTQLCRAGDMERLLPECVVTEI